MLNPTHPDFIQIRVAHVAFPSRIFRVEGSFQSALSGRFIRAAWSMQERSFLKTLSGVVRDFVNHAFVLGLAPTESTTEIVLRTRTSTSHSLASTYHWPLPSLTNSKSEKQ
jgi:hypothetical protein